MFKFIRKVLPLVFVLMLISVLPVFAFKAATMGNYNTGARTDDTYDIEIDDAGLINTYGGLLAKYEVVTTNNTITISESGTTYIVEGVHATSAVTVFYLPEAEVGAEFTIVVGGGMTHSTDGNIDLPNVELEPTDRDTFYVANSATSAAYDAGDKTYSTGTTGDSIHIICPVVDTWYVVDFIGTWADGS